MGINEIFGSIESKIEKDIENDIETGFSGAVSGNSDANMPNCTACNKQFPQGTKFCPDCGAALKA